MRYLFLLLVLVSVSSAQIVVERGASYTATDTTAWVGIDAIRPVKVAFYARDSVNLQILMDYRGASAAATAYQTRTLSDSTNSPTDNGYYNGYTLRSASVDSLPGASTVRFRLVKKTTRNGTTSPTYNLFIYQ